MVRRNDIAFHLLRITVVFFMILKINICKEQPKEQPIHLNGHVGHIFQYDLLHHEFGIKKSQLSQIKVIDTDTYEESLPKWLHFKNDYTVHGLPLTNYDTNLTVLLFCKIFMQNIKLCKSYSLDIEIRYSEDSLLHSLQNYQSNNQSNINQSECLHPSNKVLIHSYIVSTNENNVFDKAKQLSKELGYEFNLIQVLKENDRYISYKQLNELSIHKVAASFTHVNPHDYVFSFILHCYNNTDTIKRHISRRSVHNEGWYVTSGRLRRAKREIFFGSISAIVGTPLETSVLLTKSTLKSIISSVKKTAISSGIPHQTTLMSSKDIRISVVVSTPITSRSKTAELTSSKYLSLLRSNKISYPSFDSTIFSSSFSSSSLSIIYSIESISTADLRSWFSTPYVSTYNIQTLYHTLSSHSLPSKTVVTPTKSFNSAVTTYSTTKLMSKHHTLLLTTTDTTTTDTVPTISISRAVTKSPLLTIKPSASFEINQSTVNTELQSNSKYSIKNSQTTLHTLTYRSLHTVRSMNQSTILYFNISKSVSDIKSHASSVISNMSSQTFTPIESIKPTMSTKYSTKLTATYKISSYMLNVSTTDQISSKIKPTISYQISSNVKPTVSYQISSKIKPTVSYQISSNAKLTVSYQISSNVKPTRSYQISSNVKPTRSYQISSNLVLTSNHQVTSSIDQTSSSSLLYSIAPTFSDNYFNSTVLVSSSIERSFSKYTSYGSSFNVTASIRGVVTSSSSLLSTFSNVHQASTVVLISTHFIGIKSTSNFSLPVSSSYNSMKPSVHYSTTLSEVYSNLHSSNSYLQTSGFYNISVVSSVFSTMYVSKTSLSSTPYLQSGITIRTVTSSYKSLTIRNSTLYSFIETSIQSSSNIRSRIKNSKTTQLIRLFSSSLAKLSSLSSMPSYTNSTTRIQLVTSYSPSKNISFVPTITMTDSSTLIASISTNLVASITSTVGASVSILNTLSTFSSLISISSSVLSVSISSSSYSLTSTSITSRYSSISLSTFTIDYTTLSTASQASIPISSSFTKTIQKETTLASSPIASTLSTYTPITSSLLTELINPSMSTSSLMEHSVKTLTSLYYITTSSFTNIYSKQETMKVMSSRSAYILSISSTFLSFSNILTRITSPSLISSPYLHSTPTTPKVISTSSIVVPEIMSTSTPVVIVGTSTPVVIVSTSNPVVIVSTSTPVVIVSTSTPVVIVSTSTPVVTVSTLTPVVIVSTSTPVVTVSTSIPVVIMITSTSIIPVLVSTSTTIIPVLISTSTPIIPVLISTSTPIVPVLISTSTPIIPVFISTSTPIIPVLISTSTPIIPVLISTSTLIIPVFISTSTPIIPVLVSTSTPIIPVLVNTSTPIVPVLINTSTPVLTTPKSSIITTLTTPTTSNAPILISPIGHLFAHTGRLFSYKIKKDTFNDIEDGDTSNLTLTLKPTSGGDFLLNDWLFFNSSSQTISGVPVNNDFTNQNPVSLMLYAYDKTGLFAVDEFLIVISEPLKSLTFSITVTIAMNYTIFLRHKHLKESFMQHLKEFFNFDSLNDLYINSITKGSTKIEWSNTVGGINQCNRTFIQNTINAVQNPQSNTPNSDFAQFMLPLFPVIGIRTKYSGVCALNVTDPPPVTVAIAASDNNFVYYAVPVIIVAIILLIVLIVILIFWRNRKKNRYYTNQPYFPNKPVLFPDELELQQIPGSTRMNDNIGYEKDEVDGASRSPSSTNSSAKYSYSYSSSYSNNSNSPSEAPPPYLMPPVYSKPFFSDESEV